MGKTELFTGLKGTLFLRLGAFPVRRGTSDAEALETARIVLRQGGVLALFPEGTRIRDPEALGEPHSGVGRFALETGATLVPAAISGSERLFLGPLPKPRRVRIASASRSPSSRTSRRARRRSSSCADELWPEVERDFGRLRAHRGLIGAGLAALGSARGSPCAGAAAAPAMTSRMLLEYDGTAFAGWARQPGLRTVQAEVEQALRTILRERRAGADRRRAHRRRRARVGPGLLLRARGGRSAAPQRAAARRRRGARLQPGADGFDARHDARLAHLLLPPAAPPRALGVARRARAGGTAGSSTARR